MDLTRKKSLVRLSDLMNPSNSILITLTIIIIITSTSNPMLFPKMLTRFCYNSPDPARVNVSKSIKNVNLHILK